jgi:hypothetical protein
MCRDPLMQFLPWHSFRTFPLESALRHSSEADRSAILFQEHENFVMRKSYSLRKAADRADCIESKRERVPLKATY